jgi:hypothetical protein
MGWLAHLAHLAHSGSWSSSDWSGIHGQRWSHLHVWGLHGKVGHLYMVFQPELLYSVAEAFQGGKGRSSKALRSRLWNPRSHSNNVLLVKASQDISPESRWANRFIPLIWKAGNTALSSNLPLLQSSFPSCWHRHLDILDMLPPSGTWGLVLLLWGSSWRWNCRITDCRLGQGFLTFSIGQSSTGKLWRMTDSCASSK